MQALLTEAIVEIVNSKQRQGNSFGVSVVNLPDIDIAMFLTGLQKRRKLELYFLGYGDARIAEITEEVSSHPGIMTAFSVEEAEESRNLGDEGVFRIHFIKNAEMEKLSSLRWYDEINMESVYKKCCKLAETKLARSNATISNLINALARKDIRSILNFERVLDYLQALIAAPESELPSKVSSELYLLGLLSDASFGIGAPSIDQIRERIKKNHVLVRRIASLEQMERQNIANYLAKNPGKQVVRLILDYYRQPRLPLLKQMDYTEVEACLKAAASSGRDRKPPKSHGHSPTVATSELIFDGQEDLVNDFVEQAVEKIDKRPETNSSSAITLESGGIKIEVPISPSTEGLTNTAVSDQQWGGIIEADVPNPKEALDDNKYSLICFDNTVISKIHEYLDRAASFPEAEAAGKAISKAFDEFIDAREKLIPFKIRLQDIPMLQIVSKCALFSNYLKAYERLLSEIKDGYKELSELDDTGAKEVIGTLLALDIVYIIGSENSHAMPTPLNPLYLWKYTRLAEEMLSARGVPEGGDCYLSEKDKEFIIRKAEDIPDPLALVMLPKNDITRTECLPYAGRLGCLPVYSSRPQISNSKAGIDTVRQNIIKYLCLYPHSSMMLRISIINPPTVEAVVEMLKQLDKDKEFASFGNVGIDLTIFRTKETSADWIELEDKSLNEGMLGKIRGRKHSSFNLSIKNECLSYQEILRRITRDQHIIVVFDPNEKKIDSARNSRTVHIHPLCVPKVYEYNKMQGSVKIRAANEGGVFSDYASIIEKLYDQPSTFGHRNVFVNTPLKKETYEALLGKADWLMILDQNLSSWDVSFQSASERLYYKGSDFRSFGIYSKNCRKFALGYQEIISGLGNYVATDPGVSGIISATRSINDDGLLSIVSHSTNQIFDQNHGKGSLGLAITAILYKCRYPDAVLVGLDTQLAREWLADRDDAKLPDLIGIRFSDADTLPPAVDLIEVKTHPDYRVDADGLISGHAVDQVSVLNGLILEMFGKNEKITTVSRREILREQVFECVFNNTSCDPNKTQLLIQRLNGLFAGEYSVTPVRNIFHVDFDAAESKQNVYKAADGFDYHLCIIGSDIIRAILTDALITPVLQFDNPTTSEPVSTGFSSTPDDNVCTSLGASNETGGTLSNSIIEATDEQTNTSEQSALSQNNPSAVTDTPQPSYELREKCIRLNVVLKSYGIQAQPIDASLVQQAARFTRFKLELKPGETEANLKKRSEDIARELEAAGEVFIGRIPGTRYIGLDVPFGDSSKPIMLVDYLDRLSSARGALSILAGQAPDGAIQVIDLAKAPHMLIAGTTGSGKTIFLYSIIVSLLQQYSADELELLIVDPKQTDFHFFEGLPHLRGNQVLTDADEAIHALETINTVDKQKRTELIKSVNSRDIDSYNAKTTTGKMKRLVVVIDEYADLVQAAELQGKDVRKTFEANLCMLAQRVRNLGIHLVIATQQPRATIVTSQLKAVLPFRVSFRLPSHTDSQTILDRSGAEDLLGKGDMLMLTDSDMLRMQGFFITEEQLIKFIESKKG